MVYTSVEKLRTNDDHVIFLHIYSPTQTSYAQSKCDGVILAVHGLAEHAQRYQDLAKITCAHNKIFVAFDLREHGQHAAKNKRMQNLSCLISDIEFIFLALKKLFPQIPPNSFALFGHSFGGLLATYAAAALKTEVKKLFLSAPCYANAIKVPAWKKILAQVMTRFFPTLKVSIEIDPSLISNNPENNALYSKDIHILKKLSLQIGKLILDLMEENRIKNTLSHITADVTLLLPLDDKIVDSTVTKKLLPFFKTNTFLHEISHAGHESFNELHDTQKLAFSYYEKWLDSL